jgi:UDP:flavonoid glycosyltransferase YjiC (YdhE family)
MARFLICTMPITGHVNPGLPIARALVERGHTVRWYTGRRFQSAIEATGARYMPMQSAYDFDDRDLTAAFPQLAQASGWGRRNAGIKHIFLDPIPGQVEDLRRILRDFPADVLLSEALFAGAGVAHELGGPPWASFGISALSISSRDTAPFNIVLPPDASRLGRARNWLLNQLSSRVILGDANQYLNQLRSALGLPALREDVFDVISPYLYLQPSTPAFEYPRGDLPPQVHFIGPLLFRPSEQFTPLGWWNELDGSRPVILVNQGTIATNPYDLLVPALRGLAGEDVLVVATTGGKPVESVRRAVAEQANRERRFEEAHTVGAVPTIMGGVVFPPSSSMLASTQAHELDLPTNARVEPFVPFPSLMPHVDVMLTNGGYGGVQFALTHGVPLVVAGATEEKPEIAARVAWSGAGINLRTGKPSPERIRAAVREVMRNHSYRRNAERIRAEYRSHDAPAEAVALLEQLALTRRPVLRVSSRAKGQPRSAQLGRGRARTSVDI